MYRRTMLFIILALLSSCTEQRGGPSGVDNTYKDLVGMTEKKTFENPKDFLAQAYCYFVFQAIIDPVEVTPRLFSLYVKGGSLSASHLENYTQWLNEKNGQLCQEVIGPSFQHISLQEEKKYIVFLNKKAIQRDGEELDLIHQHELLHVAYAHFKENKKRVQKLWKELSPEQQMSFKQKHSGYNFKNEDVLWREYFAYTFQKRPGEGVLMLAR